MKIKLNNLPVGKKVLNNGLHEIIHKNNEVVILKDCRTGERVYAHKDDEVLVITNHS